jgi:hypothetical protein
MPKIQYQALTLNETKLKVVKVADAIIHEYQAQGFDLTLRQLYYQFVARGYLPNSLKSYKTLQDIVNDGRLAGLLDWTAIVDRTRNMVNQMHWGSPERAVKRVAGMYREDVWADQPYRVEVWIEKDALMGILEAVCPELDVPYFSCRGFSSQSEMWAAGQRMVKRAEAGQQTVVLHLADHDPSGIGMSHDIGKRLTMFTTRHLKATNVFTLRRIALTMKQVERYNPPPNPAKMTDPRYKKYREKYGESSWELDALDPAVLVRLVRRKVAKWVDAEKMAAALARQEDARNQLQTVSGKWKHALAACS